MRIPDFIFLDLKNCFHEFVFFIDKTKYELGPPIDLWKKRQNSKLCFRQGFQGISKLMRALDDSDYEMESNLETRAVIYVRIRY